jgi:hypothetical protein
MSRTCTFKQHDLARALRAAVDAGLEVTSYEIEPGTGKIKINTATTTSPVADEFEQWKACHAD